MFWAMPTPTPTLGDRLAATRHARFVGREAELDRFRQAFQAEPPFHVAHVFGPGGIGKTALLDEAAQIARDAGVGVARLDGRDVDATPAAFAKAAGAALDAADGAAAGRRVLLVDTYERVSDLDGWLRRTFVPGLRDTDLVVIAGRHRPAPDWRAAWAGEVAVFPLRNLASDEADAYLASQGVPAASRDRILAFTHGHPLALTLVAERVRQDGAEGAAFDPAAAPDLLADLLGRFTSAVPTPAHRAALEGAAVVRSVTVPLLAALTMPDGDGAATEASEALFEWLRGLGFAEADAAGVRLHDVVRETVEADLQWRDPERHAEIHARARRAYADRLRRAAGDGHRRALADYLHLYRHHAVVRPLLGQLQTAWAEADLAGSGPLRPGDAAAVRALVARHHGDDEAARVAGWLDRQPGAAEVFTSTDGSVAGFLLTLALDALDPAERDADPVAAAVFGAGPGLRGGERALLFRSWLDAEAGQGVSAVQSLVFARTVERYLATPGLASSALLTDRPDLWGPAFEMVGLQRWTAAEAGPLAAFGKDWRAMPPDVWLDALADRAPLDPPALDPADTLVVLSEDAFGDAVRDAIKCVAQPHLLAESPLLQARLVREHGGEPVEALRDLIAEAARQLDAGGKERRYFHAFDLTYLRAAPTQAVAAERLDLAFSTYRRYLGRAVDHVVDVLWRAETGA